MGEGRGVEKEMERCAEAVVCMRDWDGRRMKDLAWCVAYAASDPTLRPAHSSKNSTSYLSSPKISGRSVSPEPHGENADGAGAGDGDGGGRTHPDVALFTHQLVETFGRFYGAGMRGEFVGYLREYGRETFVGWWEAVRVVSSSVSSSSHHPIILLAS